MRKRLVACAWDKFLALPGVTAAVEDVSDTWATRRAVAHSVSAAARSYRPMPAGQEVWALVDMDVVDVPKAARRMAHLERAVDTAAVAVADALVGQRFEASASTEWHGYTVVGTMPKVGEPPWSSFVKEDGSLCAIRGTFNSDRSTLSLWNDRLNVLAVRWIGDGSSVRPSSRRRLRIRRDSSRSCSISSVGSDDDDVVGIDDDDDDDDDDDEQSGLSLLAAAAAAVASVRPRRTSGNVVKESCSDEDENDTLPPFARRRRITLNTQRLLETETDVGVIHT